MFSRLLVVALLVCVASAEFWQSTTPASRSHSFRVKSLHHHQQHRVHHHHQHRHYAHHHGRHQPKTIVALDEIIKKKHPAEFLGKQFIRKQLMAQKGAYKFLRLSGKEQHDVNGTIALNKQGLVVNVNEAKDGNFVVQDMHNRVVGAVGMHGRSYKHIDSHKNPSGHSYTNAVHTGRADLSIESDLPRKPKDHGPIRHMTARVSQNYEGRANIQVHPVQQRPQYYRRSPSYAGPQTYRYRREAVQQVNNEIPCSENGCLDQINNIA